MIIDKNNIQTIKFDDTKGLVPAVIQDVDTKNILMLGYMNIESLQRTFRDKKVWFYSRSRKQLWMKGETSGNILKLVSISADCDKDTLLVKAQPTGPVCHLGDQTCFENSNEMSFLHTLFLLLQARKQKAP